MDTNSAIVVGAGIGGLTAAIALRRIGSTVTVLEQAPVIADVGAGLSLWPNAVRALEVLGLAPAVTARAVRTVSRGNFRSSDGRWRRRVHPADVGVLAVHRAELHATLRDALPEGTLHADARVVAVTDDERIAAVTYESSDGRKHELSADLVVAADGINSTTRRVLWPDHPAPVFRRRTVWRGVTGPDAVWPVQECLTLGRGEQFGLLPLTGRRAYWFLTANADLPGETYDDERAEVRRRVQGWHDPIPAVVAATLPDHVLHNDIIDLDPLATFVHGRTVLLGDAAHAMTPTSVRVPAKPSRTPSSSPTSSSPAPASRTPWPGTTSGDGSAPRRSHTPPGRRTTRRQPPAP